MDRFLARSGNNHLILDVNKTKEMIVDFRNKSISISIMREGVEVVEQYEYLSVHHDNRLDWRCNTDAVYKKGQSRHFKEAWVFHCLQKDVEYLLEVCCGDFKKLNKLIQKTGSVLEPLELMVQRRILHKEKNIMNNLEHPLNNTVIQQQCLQPEAPSDLLQMLQEVLPAHSNNLQQ